jgi:hypothetical protein
MSNIEKSGVHHIDGTYKITTYGFPLVIYGVTDICGIFHPIAFMITSHETESDFYTESEFQCHTKARFYW